MTLTKKELLINELSAYSKVMVAFSGGIDSTVVLAAALKTLGKENVLAVVANSELFTNEEYAKAIRLAKKLGANVKGITLNYLTNDNVRHNRVSSWYWMKKMFYQRMNELKTAYGYDVVLDGMIMDDNLDFRPGLRARDEEGAVSILQHADIYKVDVRQIAREAGLTNWNKVASCSLSSRFEYNSIITVEKIQMVMQAEAYLRSLGFATVRVRVLDKLARIEVMKDQINDLVMQMSTINTTLKGLGFTYVTVDLEGFKSGRMNERLDVEEKAALVD
ncbi:ATP-dependent sacrificial sulfur transferase LarE [Lentilactobacillus raoultii]|uniref:ATP-dependent sacrificial sulfur transferase LarE n=1 Tax=Lentilactobacillus raoultii TaxID=1987503 RepID=A0ABW3PWW7_9LACO|nr:ATP-dependent sacrificial sulfur transferase LarE [Lentilactobacillus raoultii]